MHEAMTKIEARALLVGHNGAANALWLLSGLILFLPGSLAPLARRLLALPQLQTAFPGGKGTALALIFVLSLVALVSSVLLCAPLKAGRMAWFWRQSGRRASITAREPCSPHFGPRAGPCGPWGCGSPC